MIDESLLHSAMENYGNYKAELEQARNLQAAGLTIPSTKIRDFQAVINTASRQAMSALGESDPKRLESLGELLLNASRNIFQGIEDRTAGRATQLW